MNKNKLLLLLFVSLVFCKILPAQSPKTDISFLVTMENPASHYFHVTMTCNNIKKDGLELKMSAWTPGYYQIVDFEKAVEHFQAADAKGNTLDVKKPGANNWLVQTGGSNVVTINYDVKAVVPFVGNAFLDEERGYITPGAVFLYTDDALKKPVVVTVKPYSGWPSLVATGLDSVAGKSNSFLATDYDVLFDSPLLMGKLESLPSFKVKGIPHYFIGYNPGNFDRKAFMDDLEKIVKSGVAIIGDIPYTHYTFLLIGAGGGGIEHLNSSSLSFSKGQRLDTHEEKIRLYHFIAHEYFHNFNVKRIRPVELGPFDYSKENRTNMLWVSEGLSVYYEYLITQRAGLTTEEDLLKSFQYNLKAYENEPGHLYQSATQASYETWSDGPNGRKDDEMNKTISYYEKGPLLGMMLDFKIRHETQNRHSLDDVMRLLYRKYYQEKKRGFTEQEFQTECEIIAGSSLKEVFSYASTVDPIDYPKYFAYAGLDIDTLVREIPGPYLGISTHRSDAGVVVSEATWNSPSWNAGIRKRDTLLEINGAKAFPGLLETVLAGKKDGDTVKLLVARRSGKVEIPVVVGNLREKLFTIKQIANPTPLQSAIYTAWVKTD